MQHDWYCASHCRTMQFSSSCWQHRSTTWPIAESCEAVQNGKNRRWGIEILLRRRWWCKQSRADKQRQKWGGLHQIKKKPFCSHFTKKHCWPQKGHLYYVWIYFMFTTLLYVTTMYYVWCMRQERKLNGRYTASCEEISLPCNDLSAQPISRNHLRRTGVQCGGRSVKNLGQSVDNLMLQQHCWLQGCQL